MRAISRKTVAWIAVALGLGALPIGCRSAVRYKEERARARWKDATLSRLAGLSFTNKEIVEELERARFSEGVGENRRWVSDNLLLMTNGEYVVYAFRHGFNSGFVDHLFLARGSDGRW